MNKQSSFLSEFWWRTNTPAFFKTFDYKQILQLSLRILITNKHSSLFPTSDEKIENLIFFQSSDAKQTL